MEFFYQGKLANLLLSLENILINMAFIVQMSF